MTSTIPSPTTTSKRRKSGKTVAAPTGLSNISDASYVMIEAKLQTIRVCDAPPPSAATPQQFYELWKNYVPTTSWFESSREQLVLFTIDVRYKCTGIHLISVGTVSETLFHPREVLRPAIIGGAHSFIVAHNHPSGDCTPSEADRAMTRRIREASDLLQIYLLDHIIVGDTYNGRPPYFSFKEHGLL
jgi:DNA repair protein RadC